MIKNIEKDKNLFYAEVTDMITKEDVEAVIPIVEDIIKQYGKMNCLILLDNVKGYTFGGFLADFNFYLKHYDSFEYLAIAGDKKFEKGIVQIFDKIMPGKAKYYDISELNKAKEWIKQR
ncbi:MAG: STAS/SEC14 domain-containing protein [Candidatus Gastranaerophilales bacterium]|nr:STAS/SEC14 domain-containing protein [Candidatus Gastranaerophilales bacterium]